MVIKTKLLAFRLATRTLRDRLMMVNLSAGDERAQVIERQPRKDPVADTAKVRDFLLDAVGKFLESEKATLVNRKRALGSDASAIQRLAETQRLNIHFTAAKTWIKSRFESENRRKGNNCRPF